MTRQAGAALGMLFIAHAAAAQFAQQGGPLLGSGAISAAAQGTSVAVSADGNTAIVGGPQDGSDWQPPNQFYFGAAWVFTRSGGVWSQQGSKLVGADAVGGAGQGRSVAISANGTTAIVGGPDDNYQSGELDSPGAAWVYTRSGGVWTQQGSKLVGSGTVSPAAQGKSVAISADGNTAIVGGPYDNYNLGASWVFTRSGGVWSQQGNELVGSGAVGDYVYQGGSVAISADGNTAIVGGDGDYPTGAAWVFIRSGGVWSQQGSKLVGTGAVGNLVYQGTSVAISADGNTAIVGGLEDAGGLGAVWIFTRSGGVWSQQGSKLVGTGAVGPSINQGTSVAISADGSMAIVGGPDDNSNAGAAWVFTRSGGVWSQQGSKLVGAGGVYGAANQGTSVALSSNANTVIVGGPGDNFSRGAAWVFVANGCSYSISPTNASVGATGGNGTVNVTIASGSNCPWSASSNASWIHVTSGSNGSGNGTVGYSVDANTGSARPGSITVAGQTFTLDQTGADSSVIVFADNFEGPFPGQWQLWFSSQSGTDTNITWGKSTYRTTGSTASIWCAGGGSEAQPQGGDYLPNEGTWVAYGPFSLVGATAASLDFDLWLNSEQNNDYMGAWISVDGQQFWGTGFWGNTGGWTHKTLNFADVTQITAIGAPQVWVALIFASNSSVEYEGAYVDNFVLRKIPASPTCTYTLNPTSQSFSAAGGGGSVAVTAGSGCAWTAAPQVSWISVTAGASGSGNGSVSYSVQANSGSARSGTITIAGQTFTVNQAALTCTYSLSSSTASFTAPGGGGNVAVTAPAGCSWTASTGFAWIHITSGSGTGSGTVYYSVDGNSGPARSGTITVQTQTLTVNEDGVSTQVFSYWIPAVSHKDVPSRNAWWRSDIAILNRSSQTANLTLNMYASSGLKTMTIPVAGKAQLLLRDVAAQLGVMADSGALQVLSDQDIFLTGRTYNQVDATHTYGQDYDGQAPSDLLAAGDMAWLPQLTESALYRTNIGITNAGTANANVTVTLYDANGNAVGWSDTRAYAPGGFYQYQQPYLAVGGIDSGYAVVTVNSGSGIVAYASVTDQQTNDPTTINMKR